MKKKSFKDLFEEARKSDEYWIAYAKLDFTEDIYRLMLEDKKTKADLAKELGVSAPYITKIFRGKATFTIETMVRLARVVGARLHIHVAHEEKEVQWVEKSEMSKNLVPSWEIAMKSTEISRLASKSRTEPWAKMLISPAEIVKLKEKGSAKFKFESERPKPKSSTSFPAEGKNGSDYVYATA